MHSEYIDNTQKLLHCIQHIEQGKRFAIDLEFDKNRFRYGFNLCLMQIFAGEKCFIIDPLSDQLDIRKIFPVLENYHIQKVVFAFGEDLRLLNLLGCQPQNIYDTSMAMKLLNYPPMSLTNALEELLDIQVGKSAQTSNWFKRPLSAEQINYASEDVLYLLELQDKIEEKAKDQHIISWIEQENKVFDTFFHAKEEQLTFIRDKDKKGLTEFEWFLLKDLLTYREELAKQFNKPSHQIIHNDFIREIAIRPELLESWTEAKGVYKGIKNENYQQQFSELMEVSKREAKLMKKSKRRPAHKNMEPEEYQKYKQRRERDEKLRKEIFKPVKQQIASKYGEHTANFILPNRLASELADGDKSGLLPYKKEIILQAGEDLDLPIGKYL